MTEEKQGHYHPITIAIRHIYKIFSDMGFNIASGPQVETEKYNFDALNIPENHPARDMWDTFWLKDSNLGDLLRTHTSPVQIRYMEENEPPFAIIAPGKTFRYEATDATHEAQFFQLEGLMVGEDVSLATLRGVLKKFLSEFFGEDMDVRMRPGYFPFVEPGVEVDMRRPTDQKGSSKGNPWIEIMGAGMVHPEVLKGVGIDGEKYQGFAFGVGIDRLVMLKTGIPDIRVLYQGDIRLTSQF